MYISSSLWMQWFIKWWSVNGEKHYKQAYIQKCRCFLACFYMSYSPSNVCHILVVCCIFLNLALKNGQQGQKLHHANCVEQNLSLHLCHCTDLHASFNKLGDKTMHPVCANKHLWLILCEYSEHFYMWQFAAMSLSVYSESCIIQA